MSILKSQLFGVLLALATAIGCIFYEKIVHNFSFVTMMLIIVVECSLLAMIGLIIFPNELKQDYINLLSLETKYWIPIIVYICTGVTSICWYLITKNQGVMVGSIYEVKYIVILAVLYIMFGDNKFTINTGIGLLLALSSIYFISKD